MSPERSETSQVRHQDCDYPFMTSEIKGLRRFQQAVGDFVRHVATKSLFDKLRANRLSSCSLPYLLFEIFSYQLRVFD